MPAGRGAAPFPPPGAAARTVRGATRDGMRTGPRRNAQEPGAVTHRAPAMFPGRSWPSAGQAVAAASWRTVRATSRASASVSTAGGEPGSGLHALSDISQTAIPPMTAAAIM